MRQARQKAFLEAYIDFYGNVTRAASEVGISRRSHYFWKAHDEFYAAKFHAISHYMKTGDENVIKNFKENIENFRENAQNTTPI